jgi:peptidoglycan/LPS O-acetylase OafA/YrhL
MQQDLRVWWWTIATVGWFVFVGLLAYPAVSKHHPPKPTWFTMVIGWYAIFLIIGIYQRTKMMWPQRPREGAATAEILAYRLALERRRDEQRRWPARRLAVIAGTIALAILLSCIPLILGTRTKPADVVWAPILIVAMAVAIYAGTRKFTNRAAKAFQQEIDDLSRTRNTRK